MTTADAVRTPNEGDKLTLWVAGLTLFGLVERALLWRYYEPASYGDTPSYFRLSKVLYQDGLFAYDATRVPGYPLFVGLLGRQESSIFLVQMGLGLAISLMLFAIAWHLTRSPAMSVLAGMIYNLSPAQLLFEANLLSETLTTFFVVAALALYVVLEGRSDTGLAIPLAMALGTVAATAGLVRTLFFVLPAVLLPFVLLIPRRWERRLAVAGAFSIPPLLLLGGWLWFVYSHYGVLSPTTMGGYHLVQHTGEFFEYLPESEAVIRDTYLKYRQAQIEARGVQTNAIWDAIPELSQKTGLSFFALSVELQRLSLRLIWEHPGLYLRNVIEGWIGFWKAPVYWRAEAARRPLIAVLPLWILVGRALAIVANGLFLLTTAAAAIVPKVRRRLRPPKVILLGASLVLVSSVIQTLVDHGDNPRFLVPLQTIVMLTLIWAGWRFVGRGSHAREG